MFFLLAVLGRLLAGHGDNAITVHLWNTLTGMLLSLVSKPSHMALFMEWLLQELRILTNDVLFQSSGTNGIVEQIDVRPNNQINQDTQLNAEH